ncbi:hypothetical protein GJ496_005143 [Pomphorhynchus laevis]|nr:hypothetical protein GJ496_005143 [Pomphorhynchus laevis]
MSIESDDKAFEAHLVIPLTDERIANIIYQVIKVDKDPRSDTSRSYVCKEDQIEVLWKANELRLIRTMASFFFEQILTIMETISEFDC